MKRILKKEKQMRKIWKKKMKKIWKKIMNSKQMKRMKMVKFNK